MQEVEDPRQKKLQHSQSLRLEHGANGDQKP